MPSEGVGEVHAVAAHGSFLPGAQPALVALAKLAPVEILLVHPRAVALPARLPPRASAHRARRARVRVARARAVGARPSVEVERRPGGGEEDAGARGRARARRRRPPPREDRDEPRRARGVRRRARRRGAARGAPRGAAREARARRSDEAEGGTEHEGGHARARAGLSGPGADAGRSFRIDESALEPPAARPSCCGTTPRCHC